MKRSLGMRGDPPARMFAVAKELLWRQRQIEVFPYVNEEVLLSLYPPQVQDVTVATENQILWGNMDKCLTRDRAVVVELLGEAGHAFWMKFETQVAAPSGGDSLTLSEINFHYIKIKAWWNRATKIHTELGAYQGKLWDFFQRADHPLLVEKYWPELLPFVDFEPLPSQETPNLSKRRIVKLPEVEVREGIIITLAASTLLEEYECTAWVDYEAEKNGGI